MKGASAACVALAALCWGVSGGIGGMFMAAGWDPFLVSFYRGAIGLLFVLVWLALRPRQSGLSNRRLWFWSMIAGLGVAGNFAFYFVSIAEGSVALAATLMYCAPVFVYLATVPGIVYATLPIVLERERVAGSKVTYTVPGTRPRNSRPQAHTLSLELVADGHQLLMFFNLAFQ